MNPVVLVTVLFPPPPPPGNSSFGSHYSLKILAFELSLPLGFPTLLEGYIYFSGNITAGQRQQSDK